MIMIANWTQKSGDRPEIVKRKSDVKSPQLVKRMLWTIFGSAENRVSEGLKAVNGARENTPKVVS